MVKLFGRGRDTAGTWLVVCLGNPGAKYEASRHNVGFLVADELAERANVPIRRLRFRSLCADVTIGGQRVLLMKPQTYMNLSGDAVREAAAFYKTPAERILVVADDTALPAGKLRIRKSGSAGGHNGLKSILSRLGGEGFPRIKIGVGAPPHPEYDLADWVLGVPAGPDKKAVDEAIARAADAVECLLADGADAAMNRFNQASRGS